MDTNEKKILYKDLSYKIIGLAMEVHLAIILNFGTQKLGYERRVE